MSGADFADLIKISKSIQNGWFSENEKIRSDAIVTIAIDEKDREILLAAALAQKKQNIFKILMAEQGIEDTIMQGWYAFILKVRRLNENRLEFLIANDPETLAPNRTFTIEYKELKMGKNYEELFSEDELNFADEIDSIIGIDELGEDLQIVTTFRFFLFSNYRIEFGIA
ncbi:hypothetical protein CH371_20090 [Leptospira wolffii]|uniref:Uncharacterized protein n=1 Tax=Leptospira wolffii TaxID=409998 RepID=A0A2M9Z6K3_9LEPT|nr:hypothetical protein [Leptospira wolffii]PJZ64059.1 hypothetical protein CH371_20090 [Leptospira wolffii]